MNKLIPGLLIGVLAGLGVGYAAFHSPETSLARFSVAPKTDLKALPEIEPAVAAVHRQERYADLQTMEDILALPGDFAETEALYLIAGRADASGLQNLIYQAAKISDRRDRNAALEILFMRLTDLDPESALAISRSPAFSGNSDHEYRVWFAWARSDLDAAIDAASIVNSTRRPRAAKALYASLKSLEGSEASLIHERLGIKPDKNVKSRLLYELANESPTEAVFYIESLESAQEQSEHYGWLGHHLGRNTEINGEDHAPLISSRAHRTLFLQSYSHQRASQQPQLVIERILGDGANRTNTNELYSAINALASSNPAKALEYADKDFSAQDGMQLKMMVLGTVARNDPRLALSWAREHDDTPDNRLLMTTIMSLAMTDPELAAAEARTLPDQRTRDNVLASVVGGAAHKDPMAAVAYLSEIENPQARLNSIEQIAAAWATQDTADAAPWLQSLEGAEQAIALDRLGMHLAETNVDAAIALLDTVPDAKPMSLKNRIAMKLATDRSFEDALAFIDRYEGDRDYPQLQASVFAVLVQKDPGRAIQMARSIENPQARDQIYVNVISQRAASDPRSALQWLDKIQNPAQVSSATQSVASNWFSRDPYAASEWLQSLPNGTRRDDAIGAIMHIGVQTIEDREALARSIGDPVKRNRALLAHVGTLMRQDPAAAERLLAEIEMSDADREVYQQALGGIAY